MAPQRDDERAQPEWHPARRRVLESLHHHWSGLTIFVEHPEVPRDNNTAERSERGPVLGRKNSSGSGAVWSGRLAALLFSLFQTLALGGLNPRVWLTASLTACAESGGQAHREAGGVVAVESVGGPTPGLVAGTTVGREFVGRDRSREQQFGCVGVGSTVPSVDREVVHRDGDPARPQPLSARPMV